VLAVVKMPRYDLEEILATQPAHLLLVEGIQDPGNLGTMFRTGEGAGVTGILMHPDTVDLFHPKTVRSTMGSIYRVPFLAVTDWEGVLRQITDAGIGLYAAHLQGQRLYDSFDYQKPWGFLIGNEGNGLTEETAAMASHYLRIPMAGQLESLNAAMAAGILMYEVNRQRRGVGCADLV
jgi:TrmH family RNA methyltransferase